MRGNRDEQLARLDIFVAQAVVLRTEDESDFSISRCRQYLRGDLARWLAVPAIKASPASRSDDQSAIPNGFANSGVTLRFAQYVPPVNRHRPRPETARAGFADNRQFCGA